MLRTGRSAFTAQRLRCVQFSGTRGDSPGANDPQVAAIGPAHGTWRPFGLAMALARVWAGGSVDNTDAQVVDGLTSGLRKCLRYVWAGTAVQRNAKAELGPSGPGRWRQTGSSRGSEDLFRRVSNLFVDGPITAFESGVDDSTFPRFAV